MPQTDLLWEAAMVVECGERFPNLPQPTRKRLGKLVAALREIGATPEEVEARAKQYRKVMPPSTILTLAALVNQWPRCKPGQQKTSTTKPAYHDIWIPPDWMQSK